MVRYQSQYFGSTRAGEYLLSHQKSSYHRVGWYDDIGSAVEAVLKKVSGADTDINVKIIQGHHDVVFEGFQYELEDWLKKHYPEERYSITTPSDLATHKVNDFHAEALSNGGWKGVWYRGHPRPDDDPFTDWSKIDNTGTHTVIWKVPESGLEFIFWTTYVGCTDEVPSGITDETNKSEFRIPYDWAQDSKKVTIKFAGSRDAWVDDEHKMQVWYD